MVSEEAVGVGTQSPYSSKTLLLEGGVFFFVDTTFFPFCQNNFHTFEENE